MTDPAQADRPAVDEVYFGALALADADERKEYMDRACAGDAILRQRVERLLQAQPQAKSFLEAPAAGLPDFPTAGLPASIQPGSLIGPYKLLQEIGEGGMGVVYMAEQMEPVKRRVALKVIKPGMDSRQVIARFEAERQALALMDHPNIARVLDCGTTDQGLPYFVMELVRGSPITRYSDDNHLTPRQRLELFVPICQALQHAHQKGIIHRDLKPSNILIAEYDQKPVPKIIDFGVAKALNAQLTDKTVFTQFGQVVGTLEYMSPEQSRVNHLDIDTRSDIYSLGVLLYELLTGATPLDRKRLRSAAFDEMLRIIREEDPQRPSARLSTVDTLPSIAANRHTEPKKLMAMLRGELDWIVMKALEKDRARRYETAANFSADIQHYLHDEPVMACPASVSYRFMKFARRNRIALSTISLVMLTLIAATAVSLWNARRAQNAEILAKTRLEAETQAREEARANATKARNVVDQMLTRVAEENLAESPYMQFLTTAFLNDAVSYYEEFTQTSIDDPEMQLELAKAWGRLGQAQVWIGKQTEADMALQRSVAILEQLQQETGSDPAVQIEMYKAIYWYAHFLNNRLRNFAKAESLFQRCLTIAPEIKQLFPHDPFVQGADWYIYSNLSLIRWAEGRFDESVKLTESAVEACKELRRQFPNHEEPLNAHAQSLLDLGHRCIAQRKYQQADDCFREGGVLIQQLLEKRPSKPWYREMSVQTERHRGIAQLELGRLDEAAASFKRARDVSEKLYRDFPDTDIYLQVHEGVIDSQFELARRRGFPSLQPQELQVLEADLRQIAMALEVRISDPELRAKRQQRLGAWYLYKLGDFLAEVGRKEESNTAKLRAVAVFQELAQQGRLQTGESWNRLADAQQQLGQYESALDSATKGIEFQDDKFFGYHLRGQIRLALQQYDQAVDDLTKALEYQQGYGWTWFHRATAHGHLGHYSLAAADYRQAVEHEPANAGFHSNLGDALVQMGEFGEALQSFQTALDLQPGNEHCRAKIEEIQAKLTDNE